MQCSPSFFAVVLVAGLAGSALAADESSETAMSRHQMMKECMAKQKASDGGMPKEDMKRNCREVTESEAENAKSERAEEKAVEKDSDADKKPDKP